MTQEAVLPQDVVVTETVHGIHYRLPPHELGLFRWAGVIMMVFGLVPIGMAVAFISFALSMGGMALAPLIGLICCLPVLLAFCGFGGMFLFFGAWVLAGRSDIELTSKKIRTILCAGPFRWSRQRPRALIRQFTVVCPRNSLAVQIGGRELRTAWRKLQAECAGSKPLMLAVGYPQETLLALARDLSVRAAPSPGEFVEAVSDEPIAVAEEIEDPAVTSERPRQPPESPAIFQQFTDGVTITLPLAGVWGGSSHFFILFTLAWCLMLVLITIVFVIVAVTGNWKDENGQPINPLLVALFTVPFWLAGIGFMAAILHRGRRSAVLAVAGDQLMILQTGLFSSRQQEWVRQELRSVRAEVTKNTDTEGATTYTTELWIELSAGPPVKLLGHRDKREVEWIATMLRKALKLSATGGDSAQL
jgi:hypothetical protein